MAIDPVSLAVAGAGAAAGAVANYAGQSEAASASREALYWNRLAYKEAQAREDNAVQRRVADLRAAGLSPTLAAGSAASSMAPIQLGAPATVNAGESVQAALNGIMAVSQLGKTQADIMLTKAQAQNVQYDTMSKAWHDKLQEAMFPQKFRQAIADEFATRMRGGLDARTLARDQASNLRPGSFWGDTADLLLLLKKDLGASGGMLDGLIRGATGRTWELNIPKGGK